MALAAHAGLVLDEWQAEDLKLQMSLRSDGKWACFEHAEIVARQNGKGSIIEVRELAALFLIPTDRMILHSAHEAKTSKNAFDRLETLITETPELNERVYKIFRSNEKTGIELLDGKEIRFVTRTKGGGRGFSGDLVVMDEAYELGPDEVAALLPILAARVNAQLLYASSAGMSHSQHLHSVRRRALSRHKDQRLSLGYCEYSCDVESPDFDAADHQAWADCNPALDMRLAVEKIELERQIMTHEKFLRERLTIFDPDMSGTERLIADGAWEAAGDEESEPVGSLVLGVAVSLDRKYAALGVAGRTSAGRWHVEVTKHERGTGWAVAEVQRLQRKHSDLKHVVLDAGGPAGSLLNDLTAEGIEVEKLSGQRYAAACGAFMAAVTDEAGPRLAHLGQSELDQAVATVQKRNLGDSWAWARGDDVDISPLEAVTIALGFLMTLPAEEPKKVGAYAAIVDMPI